MTDDPIDLTALDPDADPDAEARFVGAVMARIATRAPAYPTRADALWGASSLARPVLIAASVAIVVAGIVMVRASRDTGPQTVAESLGVPPLFQIVSPPAAPAIGGPR
jgi:anti-sigma-K factor RskA